jgi:hypothetical protein
MKAMGWSAYRLTSLIAVASSSGSQQLWFGAIKIRKSPRSICNGMLAARLAKGYEAPVPTLTRRRRKSSPPQEKQAPCRAPLDRFLIDLRVDDIEGIGAAN